MIWKCNYGFKFEDYETSLIADKDSSGEVLSGNMMENMTSGEPPSGDTGFTTSGGGSIGEGGELSSGVSSSEGTSSGELSSGDLCDRLTINCSRINRTELDSDRTRTLDDLDESNSGGSGGNLTWIQTSGLNSTDRRGKRIERICDDKRWSFRSNDVLFRQR